MDQKNKATLGRLAVTLAIAAVGGTTFGMLGLPAGWMTGAMTAVAGSGMAKVRVDVPPALQNTLFVLIGSILGTSVSPELVSELHHWPISLTILFINVLAVHFAVEFYLRRICRWDKQTAFFSAVPGLTSYIIALALPTRADVSRIAVSQTVRIFLLVLLLPNILGFIGFVDGGPARAPMPDAGPLDVLATLAAGTVGAVIIHFTKLPAGLVIGAMIGSGILHGFGIVHGGFPLAIQIPIYIALGAMIGVRFSGTSPQTLLSLLLPSFGSFVVGLVVAVLGVLVTALLVTVPLSQLLLAFAPGGIDVMTAVAFAVGLDAAFVAGHQLARFFVITLYVPILMRRVIGPRPPPPT